MSKKGFTLIELLVVISIIGMLSSIVLSSLNSARKKGADAAIISGLANMRAQAELFYGTISGYQGVCTNMTTGIGTMLAEVTKTYGPTTNACADNANGWSAGAKLSGIGPAAWCVSSYGSSKSTTTAVLGTGSWAYTSCQ
jgi:prepilin-type N-terminal cleavage/methylation domain-containing protein